MLIRSWQKQWPPQQGWVLMHLEREAAQGLERKNLGASSHPLAWCEVTLILRKEALLNVQRSGIGSGRGAGERLLWAYPLLRV
jgi:hypothetical protein